MAYAKTGFAWFALFLIGAAIVSEVAEAESGVLADRSRLLLSLPREPEVPTPKALPAHPRLILTSSREAEVLQFVKNDSDASLYLSRLIEHANVFLPLPPVARPAPGPSGILLAARDVLQRIYAFALVYRLTGNTTFADRCLVELLNCTQWSDWNTEQHALDTGELSHGVAIGFDWLYNYMTAAQRATLLQGIIKNSLVPYHAAYTAPTAWWVNSPSNWCQVVNGGAIIMALAVMDEPAVPSYVRDMIFPSALVGIRTSIAEYAPDGSWWEGATYHDYASRYFVPAAASLLTAWGGNDTGLLSFSGVNDLADFPTFSISNTRRYFNWADCGSTLSDQSHLFFLASYFNDGAAAYITRALASAGFVSADDNGSDAMVYPFGLIFFTPLGQFADVEALPLVKAFLPRYMVTARSAWDDINATFVGWKGGDSTWNHGHLDAGGFVFETQQQRFAFDLGPDNYGLPGYFGPQRFDYYRLNTRGHNTLMFDGQSQNVKGVAPIVLFAEGASTSSVGGVADCWGIVDLTDMYAAQGVDTSKRGFVSLNNRSQLIVYDEITLASKAALSNVTWALHTYANVSIAAPDRVELSSGGVTATLALLPDTNCPGGQFAAIDVRLAPPQDPTDGLTRVEFAAAADSCTRIAAIIGVSVNANIRLNPLSAWSESGPLA